jgi:hypothetical protein
MGDHTSKPVIGASPVAEPFLSGVGSIRVKVPKVQERSRGVTFHSHLAPPASQVGGSRRCWHDPAVFPACTTEAGTGWNNADPLDVRVIERNRRIRRVQGSGNPYVADERRL